MDVSPLLRSTRMLWAAVLSGLVLIAAIVLMTSDADPDLPVVLPAALVAATGVAAVVGIVAVDRTFAAAPPRDDDAAVTEYRVRLIMQFAIVEAPVLLSVILAFVLGPAWIVLIGAGAAVTGLLRVRPTTARLRRFDTTWQAAGHDVSLERALRSHGEVP